MTPFFISGNGGCGTSLLRGLLNAHPDIECCFELWCERRDIDLCIIDWQKQAEESEYKIWGNKIPFEQFLTHKIVDENIIKLADNFKIIWMQRRFSRYVKKKREHNKYRKNWEHAIDIYWKMKELHPTTVMQVSFEDLITRPYIELVRICDFIGTSYHAHMVKGTQETGHPNYNYDQILKEKV